jgi:hypothetical protein
VNTSGKAIGAGGKGFSAEIRVEGLEQTIAALRSLEPDVLKRMNKTLKDAARGITSGAASSFASTGHGPGRYVVRQTSRGKKTGIRIMAGGKEEAIFEFAGTKMSNKSGKGPITAQGAAMVRWLDGFGKPGRFLWAEFDQRRDVFEAELKSAMADAERELQASLNAAGEVF